MHALILTPNLLHSTTLCNALKRHNIKSIAVSPTSLNFHFLETDAVLLPHTLSEEEWKRAHLFFKNLSRGIPILFFGNEQRSKLKEEAFRGLLRQSIFIDESIPLSELPFLIKEMVQNNSPERSLEVGKLSIDRINRTVTFAGQTVELARKEFFLLELLILNSGRIISRDYIIDYVWDKRSYVSQNTIDVYMSRIRKKFTALSQKPLIRTIPCLGYQLTLEA